MRNKVKRFLDLGVSDNIIPERFSLGKALPSQGVFVALWATAPEKRPPEPQLMRGSGGVDC